MPDRPQRGAQKPTTDDKNKNAMHVLPRPQQGRKKPPEHSQKQQTKRKRSPICIMEPIESNNSTQLFPPFVTSSRQK